MSQEHLMGVYNRAPLEVDRGQGARLWSRDGTEYLDCVMGISTNALGHAEGNLWIGVAMSAVLTLIMSYACWRVFKSGWRLKS